MDVTDRRMIYEYIGLIFMVIVAFIVIVQYDYITTGEYNKSYDVIKLITPGILFSIYLVFLNQKKYPIPILIGYFFILLSGYALGLVLSFTTSGAAVPFVGAAGGLLISKFLEGKGRLFNKKSKKKYLIGFFSGLSGLIILFLMEDGGTTGLRLGIIISIWQFFIGGQFIYWKWNEHNNFHK